MMLNRQAWDGERMSHRPAIDKQEVAAAVAKIAVKYPEVSKVLLFGSFARGEQTDGSDVDLLVLFNGKKRYSRCFDLKAELERELARPADMLTTLQGAQPYFLDELDKDLVTVYER